MQRFTLATHRQHERLEVTTNTYEAKWFLGDVFCCIIYVGMVIQDKHSFPESLLKTSSSRLTNGRKLWKSWRSRVCDVQFYLATRGRYSIINNLKANFFLSVFLKSCSQCEILLIQFLGPQFWLNYTFLYIYSTRLPTTVAFFTMLHSWFTVFELGEISSSLTSCNIQILLTC